MTARVGVVTFPGSLDDRDAARAVAPGRRGAGSALARRPWPARRRCGDPARRLLLRRLPALRRDRPVRAGDGRPGARRPGRAAGARHLQRVPDPVRGAPAARRADPQQPGCGSSTGTSGCGSSTRHPVDRRLRAGQEITRGAQERRGLPTSPTPPRWPGSSQAGGGRPVLPAAARTAPRATSPASRTPRGTWSGSCRTPSTRSTR